MLVRSIQHKRDGEYHANQEARERQRSRNQEELNGKEEEKRETTLKTRIF
jgi:hypothetical protein